MTYWQSKVAVVTGASQGFGKILAEHLVRQGCHVVLVARNPERLEAAAKEIDPSGQRTTLLPTDVTLDDDVVERFAQVSQH